MRPIDGDRLLSERMKSKYYHLPNGDIAIPIIDIENAPTIEPEIIHCEECVYRNNTGTSLRWLPCMVVATGDYWFCGSGKRAEGRER